MADPLPARYRFGTFVLEPDERRLLRHGEPVELTPKALDLLTVLVAHHGHLVTKEDLLAAVWPDAVVEESVLSVNVSRLRAALGESAGEGRYIETVPRSGYRFVSDVEAGPPGGVTEETTVMRRTRTQVRVEETEGSRPLTVLGSVIVLTVLGSVIVLGAVALGVGTWRAPTASAEADAAPVASPVAGGVAVPLRRDLAEAAYARGRALWWTRRVAPPGSLTDAEEFRLALHYDSTFAPAYVGLAAVHALGYSTAREVYPLLDQALALDPELSDAYAVRGFTRMMHEWDWAGAEADYRRALALDPADVSSLQWLATLRMIQRRPEEAEALLRQALAVAPVQARTVLQADRAQALYYAGAYEESVAAYEHAQKHDPGMPMGRAYVAWALLQLDRPTDALAFIDALGVPTAPGGLRTAATTGTPALVRTLLLVPDPTKSLYAPIMLARLQTFLGETESALEDLERAAAVRDFLLPFVNADPVFDPLRDDHRFIALMGRMGLE